MKLQDILGSLPDGSWVAASAQLLSVQGRYSLSAQECKGLVEQVEKALETGDDALATNLLYAGLVLDGPRMLARIQKKGLLRMSRYSYRDVPLVPVVTDLSKPALGLSAAAVAYLTSVSNLYKVGHAIRKEYEQLTQWLAVEREAGIKATLAIVDFLFLKQAVGMHETSIKTIPSRHPFFFSVEQLAEGLSSLLALYGTEFGRLQSNLSIPEGAIDAERYIRFLISACHLQMFREWEFQIDRLGYCLIESSTADTFTMEPPTPEFGRAVELGFIHTNQQRAIKTGDWFDKDAHSFHDFAPRAVQTMEEAGLIRLLKEPNERYRFEFPADVLTSLAQVEELFQEEKIALKGACRDLLTPVDQLLDFDLNNGLTLRDLFQVSRLMQFIRSITAAKLVPELEAHPNHVLQSLIPVFQKPILIGLVGTVIGEDKAERAIDMMCLDIKGHVDLQYQPLVPVGEQIMLPANIFASSHVFRNSLLVIGKRLYEDGKVDPLVDLIADVFQEQGLSPQTRVNYAWGGEKGEADVLILIDNILFVLECKNSLVPTGPHELRTSLDYIEEAAIQLSRWQKHFQDPKFRQSLVKKTGLAIDHKTRLVTGVIMSNRMFMGYRIDGHPVRGAYELEHFIREGNISMGDEVFSYWEGNALSADDLRRYFEQDLTYVAQWKAMTPFVETYQFDGCTVCVQRLYKDLLQLTDEYGFAKGREAILEQQAKYEKAVKEFSMLKFYKERRGTEGVEDE
jgi:hypothetical protein